MRTYLRWIRWNGKMMVNHPLGYIVAVYAYIAAVLVGWTWLARRAERQQQAEFDARVLESNFQTYQVPSNVGVNPFVKN
jgi:hypothetical protein